MTFTVTYRERSGALAEVEVEAAGRGEVFAQCKARGITPVKVAEGASAGRVSSHTSAKRKLSTLNSSLLTAIAALAAIFLVAGIGAWWWLGREEARPSPPPVEKPKAGSRPESRPAKPRVTPPATNAPTATPAPVTNAPTASVTTGKVIKARSARSGRVMTLPDGTVVTNTPRIFFKRDFERAFHVALMPNGMGGALLRQVRTRYTDDQILAMLNERVLPEPGDDATAVAVKERVQSFKEEVLRTIANGATVAEVFDSMTRRKTEDGLLRANALKIRTEALRSGDPESGRQGIEAANVILEENGLRQVEIPRKLQAEKPAPDGNEDAAAKEDTLNKQDDMENQGEQR